MSNKHTIFLDTGKDGPHAYMDTRTRRVAISFLAKDVHEESSTQPPDEWLAVQIPDNMMDALCAYWQSMSSKQKERPLPLNEGRPRMVRILKRARKPCTKCRQVNCYCAAKPEKSTKQTYGWQEAPSGGVLPCEWQHKVRVCFSNGDEEEGQAGSFEWKSQKAKAGRVILSWKYVRPSSKKPKVK